MAYDNFHLRILQDFINFYWMICFLARSNLDLPDAPRTEIKDSHSISTTIIFLRLERPTAYEGKSRQACGMSCGSQPRKNVSNDI